MTRSYVLTLAAETDLREIIRYTRREWGAAQARLYAGRLQRCVEALAARESRGRDASALHPGLQMARCEHHFVFWVFRPDAPALVVAILHERMDLVARIAGRVG